MVVPGTDCVDERWMMHRTGKYKTINVVFGFFPFIGTYLILKIREDSGWWQEWFSIVLLLPLFYS